MWWMVWNGACLRISGACSIGFDLYSSQHQEGLRLNMHGKGRSLVRVSSIASTGSVPSSCLYTLSDLNIPLLILGPFLLRHTAKYLVIPRRPAFT